MQPIIAPLRVDPLLITTIKARTTAGITIQNSSGSSVLLLGAGPSQGVTAYGQFNSVAISDISSSGITTIQASTQDGMRILGRAGGTSSYVMTLTPTTLTASRTVTFPDAAITVAGINLAQTWTAAQTFTTGTTTISTADINGGAIDGTVIGASSAAAATVTTLSASSTLSVGSLATFTRSDNTASLFSNIRLQRGTGAGAYAAISTTGDTANGVASMVFEVGATGGNRFSITSSTAALTVALTATSITATGDGVFGAASLLASERLRVAGGTMGTPGATDVIVAAGKVYAGDTSATSIQTAGGITLASIAATTTAGAVQRESNQDKLYAYANGIGGWVDKCIFSQYASVTQAGAVTSQSLASGTARGTRTLPANFFKQGKVLRFRLCGRYTTDAAAGNATIDIKLGSTTFRSTGSFALDNSSTNQPWILEGEITCYTTGATGTVEGVTWWGHGLTGATANADIEPMAGTGAVTIDTTASAAFDVQWTATDAGTSITCTCFRLFEVC